MAAQVERLALLSRRSPGGASRIPVSNPKVSVILTAYRRPHLLEEQVQRVLDQTVPPHEIVLWYNQPPRLLGVIARAQRVRFRNSERVRKIICDHNFGIVPRFLMAGCMEGEYVCIFDDDTMPGPRWFENCLRYVDSERAMCGTIGLRFTSDELPEVEKPRMGWEGCNERFEPVDLVGHSWFFRREWSRHFLEEEPVISSFGEDLHFCAMLQRHGIRVGCPPHPRSDRALWGSVKGHLGVDGVAISRVRDRTAEFTQVLRHEVARGYRLLVHRAGTCQGGAAP